MVSCTFDRSSSAGAGGASEKARRDGDGASCFSSFHPSPNLLFPPLHVHGTEQRQGRTFVCFLRTLEIMRNFSGGRGGQCVRGTLEKDDTVHACAAQIYRETRKVQYSNAM